jgi:PAS domain S-box-containing protein
VGLSLERKFGAGLVLLMAISLFLGGMVYGSLVKNIEDHRLVNHSQLVLRELGILLGETIDLETGVRGFVITGQDRHLVPFERALLMTGPTVRRLEGLLADYPDQRQRIAALRPLIEAQRTLLEEAIAARRDKALSPGRGSQLADRGKDVMDKIRAQIAETEASARQRLEGRAVQAAHSARTTTGSIWAAMVVNLAILGLLFRQVASEMAQRRATEASLRQSEQRFRGAFDSAAFGMAIISLDGFWLDVNLALCKTLGHTESELINSSLEAIFDPSDFQKERELQASLLSGAIPYYQLELRFRRKEPQDRWARISVALEHDLDERPLHLIAQVEDITAQRQAELFQTQAAIVQSSDDAIISKSLDGEILSWNPGAERMYGYSAMEVLGQPVSILIPHDAVDELPAIMNRLRRGERIEQYETVRRGKDGRLLNVELSVSPLLDASGKIAGAAAVARDITDRKQMEEAVRESEERFRIAFEYTNVAMVITDINHRFVRVNAAFARLFGYSETEMLRMSMGEVTHPEDLAESYARREALKVGEIPYFQMEKRYLHSDGNVFWGLANVSLARDASGRLQYYVGQVQDISGRKRAEAERDSLLERLRVQIERLPLGSFLGGPDFRFLHWNPAAERMFGFRNEEVVGRHPFEVIVPLSVQPSVQRIFDRLMAGDMEAHGSCENVTKDGRTVICRWHNTPLLRPDGTFEGVLSVAEDITEQQRAEEAVRDRAARLRAIVETAVDGIVTIDAQGLIDSFNPAAERLFGYEPDEVIGQNVSVLMPAPYHEEHDGYLCHYLRTGEKKIIGSGREVVGRRNDGSTFPLELAVSEMRVGGRRMFTGIVRDISERKRAQLLLERHAEELARSNAELEQFAHVASHDLQEPLRMVASYLELLGERYKGQLDDKADTYIGYAVDGAARMKVLIRDLLLFSRVGTKGRPLEPMESRAALDEAISNLGLAIREKAAAVTHGPLPPILGDPTQLPQLFQNLIGNALKFCEAGPPQVHVTADRDGGQWVFAVRDNGIGIAPQHSQRIFQIFQRLHGRKEYPGTGMGLAICKKVVERHGGRIWVVSQPGEGSTFCFTLPARGV